MMHLSCSRMVTSVISSDVNVDVAGWYARTYSDTMKKEGRPPPREDAGARTSTLSSLLS